MKAKRKNKNIDRVEREMARTERMINQLVREPVCLPGVRREINRNLAKISKSLAEMDKKLNRLRRRRALTRSLQRVAELVTNPKPHRERRGERGNRTSN